MKAVYTMVQYIACVVLAAAISLDTNQARGDFVLVEDFDGLELGAINGQNGWYSSSLSSEVVAMPGEDSNQALMITVDSGVIHKGATVPDGNVRMFFLRFRFEGQHSYSFGLSHLASPDQFDDFGPELRKVDAFGSLKIHNGNNYDTLTQLSQSTWYNLWIMVNNDQGNSQVWLHSRPGDHATASDQLSFNGQTVFDFRTDTNSDLINFFLKAADGGSGQDPLWLDDLYLENSDSLNLMNPSGIEIPCEIRACKGDFNCDGAVNLTDLVTLGENYNNNGDYTMGDTNDDGWVDLTDLVTLGENYNTVIIPQPASLNLLILASLLMIHRRRKITIVQ